MNRELKQDDGLRSARIRGAIIGAVVGVVIGGLVGLLSLALVRLAQ
jgi:tetrahydromethanopterin S-methyltransferase subunit F